MASLCKADRGITDSSVFDAEVGGCMSGLQFQPLSGQDLYDVDQNEQPTSGTLDGWGWTEWKGLRLAWFECLAVIQARVELDGVWLEGVFGAYIAVIPDADGKSTPLGQTPFCVAHVVNRPFSASVRLGHLSVWLKSCSHTLLSHAQFLCVAYRYHAHAWLKD